MDAPLPAAPPPPRAPPRRLGVGRRRRRAADIAALGGGRRLAQVRAALHSGMRAVITHAPRQLAAAALLVPILPEVAAPTDAPLTARGTALVSWRTLCARAEWELCLDAGASQHSGALSRRSEALLLAAVRQLEQCGALLCVPLRSRAPPLWIAPSPDRFLELAARRRPRPPADPRRHRRRHRRHRRQPRDE